MGVLLLRDYMVYIIIVITIAIAIIIELEAIIIVITIIIIMWRGLIKDIKFKVFAWFGVLELHFLILNYKKIGWCMDFIIIIIQDNNSLIAVMPLSNLKEFFIDLKVIME